MGERKFGSALSFFPYKTAPSPLKHCRFPDFGYSLLFALLPLFPSECKVNPSPVTQIAPFL